MSKSRPGLDGGHVLCDLDGTLARYESGDVGRYGITHIGAPIMPTVQLVRRWLREGRDVRIFTARSYGGNDPQRIEESQAAIEQIRDWCRVILGRALPVVWYKTHSTDLILDDIAVAVEKNVGPVLEL